MEVEIILLNLRMMKINMTLNENNKNFISYKIRIKDVKEFSITK
jgi:hypothetical protein